MKCNKKEHEKNTNCSTEKGWLVPQQLTNMLVNISLRARCVGCVLFFRALSMEPPGKLFWGVPHWAARQAVNGGHKWPKEEKNFLKRWIKLFLKKFHGSRDSHLYYFQNSIYNCVAILTQLSFCYLLWPSGVCCPGCIKVWVFFAHRTFSGLKPPWLLQNGNKKIN